MTLKTFTSVPTIFLVCINLLTISLWKVDLTERSPVTDYNCGLSADFRYRRVELMEASDILKYIYWSNSSACKIGHDFGGIVFNYFDGAVIDGQKTICMDRELLISRPCLIYSFGINNEWSFDESMESFGCQVYSFDPSMSQEDHDHTANIHFYRIGLGAENTINAIGWKLMTLEAIYNKLKPRHGHVAIDVLKLDVEHTEWTAIPQLLKSKAFDRVKQLAIDIHFRNGLGFVEIFQMHVKVMRSLEKYGMVRFANRPNRMTVGDLLGRPSYTCFEMSFYNSRFTMD